MNERFKGMHAVVVGAGVAGTAAAHVLLDLGADVLVTDDGDEAALDVDALREAGAIVHTGPHDPRDIDGAQMVVVSPGVPPDAPVPAWARARGIPVWGELEFGARVATAPYIAVTGTNGKTTTTSMIAACFEAAGMDAIACGNIGHPFPAAAIEGHEVLVVEASSFQLATHESFHPVVSVLLNAAEDHVDWHGTVEAYRMAKAKIFQGQSRPDIHVGNRDDPVAAEISAGAPCEVVWIRRDEPADGEVGYSGPELIARLRGQEAPLGTITAEVAGYRENAAAAAAAALSFGVPALAVASGLSAHRPAGHRGETVAEIDGVRFVDNSKATNVHAALAAIAAVDGPVVLIAGGRAKGQDLSQLRRVAQRLSAVIAIGEAADELVAVMSGSTTTVRAPSMEHAVRAASECCPRPGTVLLAPACASWDVYADYTERGRDFGRAVKAIQEVSRA